MPVNPSEEELKTALIDLRTSHPTLGIAKLHAQLLTAHPEWSVGEKRTRKVLQSEGLVIVPGQGAASKESEIDDGGIYPSSQIIKGLDVKKWTTKAEVKYFGKKKGKGLVATEDIPEGEVIWKEDPFIIAPEW